MKDAREVHLQNLVKHYCTSLGRDSNSIKLQQIEGDASSRRYFHVSPFSELLAIDSPEGNRSLEFIYIANLLHSLNVVAPKVYCADLKHGYMLIENIEPCSDYYSQIDKVTDQPKQLLQYCQQALLSLQQIQSCHQSPHWLPHYDEAELQQELDLFPHWFIKKLLGASFNRHNQCQFEAISKLLIDSARQQPQVLVHRDYHCRNLLFSSSDGNESLAVIDFQDAVWGPITYDLVSLLRDCYLSYPEETVQRLSDQFCNHCIDLKLLKAEQQPQWAQWFDWMGIQRHLKVLGIFSRLYLRDNKPQYLRYLPSIAEAILNVSRGYEALYWLHHYLEELIIPALEERLKAFSDLQGAPVLKLPEF